MERRRCSTDREDNKTLPECLSHSFAIWDLYGYAYMHMIYFLCEIELSPSWLTFILSSASAGKRKSSVAHRERKFQPFDSNSTSPVDGVPSSDSASPDLLTSSNAALLGTLVTVFPGSQVVSTSTTSQLSQYRTTVTIPAHNKSLRVMASSNLSESKYLQFYLELGRGGIMSSCELDQLHYQFCLIV
jgi:hypothetical protein